jgi:pimeloyl-ACP methyl ester carboxylesterase
MNSDVAFAEVDPGHRQLRIEYQWLHPERTASPLIVFLHEGLGSLAMWRDFPLRLCEAVQCRGLVYSRPGYGRSTPRAPEEAWGPDFMHRQACVVLPSLLSSLGVDPAQEPVWLLGHSDGASISLIYAAEHPGKLAGVVVMAPHIKVEELGLRSIEAIRESYLKTDLPKRLRRYHDDPDSAFWGWNNIWLHPDFRGWSIEAELASISCPVLAIQGQEDEYGSMAQIHGIAQQLAGTECLELSDCGHSPHRDQPERVIAGIASFVQRH